MRIQGIQDFRCSRIEDSGIQGFRVFRVFRVLGFAGIQGFRVLGFRV